MGIYDKLLELKEEVKVNKTFGNKELKKELKEIMIKYWSYSRNDEINQIIILIENRDKAITDNSIKKFGKVVDNFEYGYNRGKKAWDKYKKKK